MEKPTEFAVYRTFPDADQASALASLLFEKGIRCKINDPNETFNKTMFGASNPNGVQVEIQRKDFETANQLLDEELTKSLDDVDDNHYLFSFENNELEEILQKPDEWNALDYKLARKILEKRGVVFSESEIVDMANQRADNLELPEQKKPGLMFVGYFFAAMGGFIGIGVGIYLLYGSKTLPDGRKIYTATDSERNHGFAIILIGIISMVFFLWLKIKA